MLEKAVSRKRWAWLHTMRKQHAYLLMLLPGVAYYVIFKYIPIVSGVMLSVVKYNLRKGILASPVLDPWYKNFQFFVQSPYFTQLLSNTLIISLQKMLIGLPLAVLLAIFLFECRSTRFRRAIQTLTYMPHFLSWVVIYGMCFALFSETNGLLNDWIRTLTGRTLPFFSSQPIFRNLIIWSDIWKSTGWSAILYMAAISGIDPNLYEAASIDGCSRVRSIWHITLPSIMPVVVLTLILRCGSILDAGFEQIFVMYNTAVRPAVDIIDTWVYRTGLENMNLPLASAVGLFKSIISFALVVATNNVARRWGGSMW
ncbi:MAG TPA: ABC transporter permease subunit [Clostridia bacterium]|nr:ABC transporter permease subunit [Clostridia bacterium]